MLPTKRRSVKEQTTACLEILEEPQRVSRPSEEYDGIDERSSFNSTERTDERSSSFQNTKPSSKLFNEPSSEQPSSFNSTERADGRLSSLNPTDPFTGVQNRSTNNPATQPRLAKDNLKPSGRFLMCPSVQPN
jgi:hypothetical protein